MEEFPAVNVFSLKISFALEVLVNFEGVQNRVKDKFAARAFCRFSNRIKIKRVDTRR